MYPMIQQQHLLPKRRDVTTSCNVDVQNVQVERDARHFESNENPSRSKHRNVKSRSLFRHIFSYCRKTWTGVKESLDSEVVEVPTIKRYRPENLQALCKLTKFSEYEMKRIYRGFKADCPSGIIREEQFKTIYSQFFPQGSNSALYAHYLFQTFDDNSTGTITFEDFIKTLSKLTYGSMEEKLRWIFSLYDTNHDGQITVEEMTEIVGAIYNLLGYSPETKSPSFDFDTIVNDTVTRLFQKMDLKRDGIITLDEFLESCYNDETILASINVFGGVIA